MKYTRKLACLTMVLGIGGVTACASDASGENGAVESMSISYASELPPEHSFNQAFEHWAELVTEDTDGAVTFNMNYAEALCGQGEMFSCVSTGTADIGVSSSGYEPSVLPLTTLGTVGFVSQDLQATASAFGDLYEESEEIQEEWENAGIVPLYHATPTPNVVAVNQDLEHFEDLAGLSLRATGDAGIALDLLNVNAVSMSTAEAYEGIERGVVDGVNTNIDTVDSNRLYEVAPNLYNTGKYQGNGLLFHAFINNSFWEQLDSEVQDAMERASDELEGGVNVQYVRELSERSCETLRDNGAEVREIGPEEAGNEWAEEARDEQVQEWSSRVGSIVEDPEALFDRYLELVEENEQEDPFVQGDYCMDIINN